MQFKKQLQVKHIIDTDIDSDHIDNVHFHNSIHF